MLAGMIDHVWPQQGSEPEPNPTASSGESFYESLHKLTPRTDEQTALKAQALGMAIDIGQTRWLLLAQSGSPISTPMLIVVIFG